MKQFEIYGENFSQIINANSMRDAIVIFELHNGQIALRAESIEECEYCGDANIHNDCAMCGAPVCCRTCCESEYKERMKSYLNNQP